MVPGPMSPNVQPKFIPTSLLAFDLVAWAWEPNGGALTRFNAGAGQRQTDRQTDGQTEIYTTQYPNH